MHLASPESQGQALWEAFHSWHGIHEKAVPLFELADGQVLQKPYGSNHRLVLQRSQDMEGMMRGLGRRLVDEHNRHAVTHQGILYMMLTREDRTLIPRYIGKAEVFGKGDKNLSVNISDLISGDGKFGRWGYNYAYHLGDLSAATCQGHEEGKVTRKYADWHDALFVPNTGEAVIPKAEIMFWATLWGPECQSVWKEFGPTRLAFEEYLLIGVASDAFGEALLNREGRTR